MLVRIWMQKSLYTVTPETTIAEAEELMARQGIRRLPVVDADNRLVGIVSKADICRASPSPLDAGAAKNARALARHAEVRSFMSVSPATVSPQDPLEKVAAMMRRNKIGGLPVVDQGRLVGIITESDIFAAFTEILSGSDDGVRLVMSIDRRPATIYEVVEIFHSRNIEIQTMTVCRDLSPGTRLLTIHFRGVEAESLIDDLWHNGYSIINIVRGSA